MIFAGLFQFSYAMDIKAKNTRFSLFLPVDFCLQKMEREPLYLVSSYRKPIVLFLIASDVVIAVFRTTLLLLLLAFFLFYPYHIIEALFIRLNLRLSQKNYSYLTFLN